MSSTRYSPTRPVSTTITYSGNKRVSSNDVTQASSDVARDEVFRNWDLLNLILARADINAVAAFFSTSKSIAEYSDEMLVDILHQRAGILLATKHCSLADYTIAIQLPRIYGSYRDIRSAYRTMFPHLEKRMVASESVPSHSTSFQGIGCEENEFPIETFDDIPVKHGRDTLGYYPNGLDDSEQMRMRKLLMRMRLKEHYLRLCVFIVLVELREKMRSPGVGAQTLSIEMSHETRAYAFASNLQDPPVSLFAHAPKQERFVQIARALCVACQLCQDVNFTWTIYVSNMEDYIAYTLTPFQDQIVKFVRNSGRRYKLRMVFKCFGSRNRSTVFRVKIKTTPALRTKFSHLDFELHRRNVNEDDVEFICSAVAL